MTERIKRDAHGLPNLTPRQVARVQLYAVEVVLKGSSRRRVSTTLLCAALCELNAHAANVQGALEAFLAKSITVAKVPLRDVAQLAIVMLGNLAKLPDDDARNAYLQTLLGADDDVDVERMPTPTTATH